MASGEAADASLTCVDQWDWKTDAPEFVPGSMKEDWNTDVPEFVPGGMEAVPDGVEVAESTACSGTAVAAIATGSATPDRRGAGWTMVSPAPANHGAGGGATATADGSQLSQLQAQYEWQLRTRSEELRDMQSRMNQLEIETAQVRASWDVERCSLVQQVNQYRSVFERYSIPLEEASSSVLASVDEGVWNDSSESSQWPTAVGQSRGIAGSSAAASSQFAGGVGPTEGGAGPSSSLDSKMRQLNHLLQGGSSSRRRSTQDAAPAEAEATENQAAKSSAAREDSKEKAEGKGSATTVRPVFPHATAHIGSKSASENQDEVARVEHLLRHLEKQTNSQVDDRAMGALTSLSIRDAREALGKVDELVTAQGGTCRNLSSILQSVCRKIEKRSGKAARTEDVASAWRSASTGLATTDQGRPSAAARAGASGGAAGRAASDQKAVAADASGQGRTRRTDEDGDALAAASSSDSERPAKALEDFPLLRTTSITSQSSNAGRRSNRSWADIQSGDEEEGGEGGEEGENDGDAPGTPREVGSEDHWTQHRVEEVAKGGFELGRKGDCWELKITMASLEPAFTEVGMERYCLWLGARLASFREENGVEPLWGCRGEVDFSHNSMSNQMVWMLLETLAQNEVHTALLKLFGNHVSQGGVLAICEFIRTNERAEPLQELHLSHNEIDDDSALELLRTIHTQRPRYPPRRVQEGTNEEKLAPVWLRLNHNRVREPDQVRKIAESEGISICTAGDRQACGTTKCCKRKCPLVHLYSFNMQARQKISDEKQTPSPEKAGPESDAASPVTRSAADRKDTDGEGAGNNWRIRSGRRGSTDKKDAGDAVE